MPSDREKRDALIIKVFEERYKDLVTYANGKVDNLAVAEELVQDTFAAACKDTASFVNSDNQVAWIYGTLRNLIRHHLRSQKLWHNTFADVALDDGENLAGEHDEHSPGLLFSGIIPDDELKLIMEIEVIGCT